MIPSKSMLRKKISKLERYFREEDPSAAVTFSVEKNHLCTVEITIRDGGTLFRAQTQAPDGDMRSAVDAAVGYIERQILKNKTRLAKRLRSENFPTAMPDDDFEVAEEKGVPDRPHQALLRQAHEPGGGHFADEPVGP